MATTKIKCIHCESEEVVKMGYQRNGTPRCKCKKCGKTFQTSYINNGSKPETKRMVIKMSVNGSRIRDIARVLEISLDTVMTVLKKRKKLTNINPKYVNTKEPIKIRLKMYEMWGRVYCKQTPCWLWYAINHENCVYSDNNFAYHDVIRSSMLKTGKDNTQKIERKHLTFRTRLKRLARKTICFSKSISMHKTMLNLLINVLKFHSQSF